ncbi:hypothetical protein AAFC00_004373 [Neodothiora populina]|uniref:Uncharacterized protein n=1 Tax=Neodothiora populina TaxID=2781224 RepID=A0ABR3PJH7_9PEZI
MSDYNNNNNDNDSGFGGGNNDNFEQRPSENYSSSSESRQEPSSSGGEQGGLGSTIERSGGDTLVNEGVNDVMNKEGVPSAADGIVDSAVDYEVNKHL